MGLRVIVYINDGICASASVSEAEGAQDIVVSDLDRAGFVLNVIKTHLEPVQIIDWLGFVIDLREGSVSVVQHKIDRLKSAITNIGCNYCPFLGKHCGTNYINELSYWASFPPADKGTLIYYQLRPRNLG